MFTASATSGKASINSRYLHAWRELTMSLTLPPAMLSMTASTSGESITFAFSSVRLSDTTAHTTA